MIKRKIFLLLILCLTLLSACSSKNERKIEEGFPLHMKVQNFKAVNQDGEQISFSDFKGKVWIADFIYTQCDSVCSPMTANMAKLQQKMAAKGINAQIVSFSIDPVNDKPAVLKNYADGVGAKYSNWNLLTGYKQNFIESFANKSFMAAAAKQKGTNQFVHSTYFYLVNKDGIVLQKYDGVADPPNDQIIKDIQKLKVF